MRHHLTHWRWQPSDQQHMHGVYMIPESLLFSYFLFANWFIQWMCFDANALEASMAAAIRKWPIHYNRIVLSQLLATNGYRLRRRWPEIQVHIRNQRDQNSDGQFTSGCGNSWQHDYRKRNPWEIATFYMIRNSRYKLARTWAVRLHRAVHNKARSDLTDECDL